VGAVVYIDSGSGDGSPDYARSKGTEVVELDLSIPFTAARARNAGCERLLEMRPTLEFVQFVDGDCSFAQAWLDRAAETLDTNPEVVAVWGSRMERFPERSIFNSICQVEWNQAPIGATRAFGGDVMMRLKGWREVGGYDPTVIAAEDDEFSVRLRRNGWLILRIDAEMTYHDAQITRLAQWWRRAVRCGYAYAQVSAIHGAPPEHYFLREKRRAWVWGLLTPLLILILAWPTHGLSFLLLGLYPLRASRTALQAIQREVPRPVAVAWGVSCSVSSFAHGVGIMKYTLDRTRKRAPTIIEYKRNVGRPADLTKSERDGR
jgi:hypothetical protein